MRLLECQAKELLRAAGVRVPASGGVVTKPAQLPAALRKAGRGPWVVKAQVLAGGRGKAGGIKVAKTRAEAAAALRAILGMTLKTAQTGTKGLKVREVLLERGAEIKKEFYFSVLVDRNSSRPVLVASAQGGMEIEAIAESRPESVLKVPLDCETGLADFAARRLAFSLGVSGDLCGDFVKIAKALVNFFIERDCMLVEVNPLALTAEGFTALDAKVMIDDNALYRHPDLAAEIDPESSALEKRAKKHSLSYIGLDGSIGCLVNGAGLAMATMDTIALAGGRPANFLDVGGSADEERALSAFRIILGSPQVKAVLVNIFGGIVKCDMIASGLVEAVRKVKPKVPMVVRLEGTNVDQAREILARSGVALTQADSLWDGAKKAVEAAKGL